MTSPRYAAAGQSRVPVPLLLRPLAWLARRSSTRLLIALLVLSSAAFVILLVQYLRTAAWGGRGAAGGMFQRRPLYEDWEGEGKLDVHAEGDDEAINHDPLAESHSVASSPDRDDSLPWATPPLDDGVMTVAIGCAITSRFEEKLSVENLAYRLPFLKTLLPSFCKTASPGFRYRFYAAFDARDPHLGEREYLGAVHVRFTEVVRLLCPRTSNVSLHFVRCRHDHNPTWAQNDAMMEAYLDHVDYYYRLNDDTLMQSPGWTEIFIEGLQGFSPPNVGVVGPLHKGGNEAILTYDFVHRTHIDVFGYYYPRVFTDWWADNWMSQVYGESRTLKLPSVRLLHTGEAGTRYDVKGNRQRFLREQIEEDRATLGAYVLSLESTKTQPLPSPNLPLLSTPPPPLYVLSMSLWGAATRYTYGALRNAALARVHFPGWRVRVYVERPRSGDGGTKYRAAPLRVVSKLQRMGVEVVGVDAGGSRVPPMMWRFLVADDMKVDAFIVRDSDCRLTPRDATVVRDWLASAATFHCVRDHPSHAPYPLLGGLWGARPRLLGVLLGGAPWRDLMMGQRADYSQDMNFLANAVWPRVKSASLCHDSVACHKWEGAVGFPVRRLGTEHLGQVFDAFGNARDEDIQLLLDHRPVPDCELVNSTSLATNRPITKIPRNLPHEILLENATAVNSTREIQRISRTPEVSVSSEKTGKAYSDDVVFPGDNMGVKLVPFTMDLRRNTSVAEKSGAHIDEVKKVRTNDGHSEMAQVVDDVKLKSSFVKVRKNETLSTGDRTERKNSMLMTAQMAPPLVNLDLAEVTRSRSPSRLDSAAAAVSDAGNTGLKPATAESVETKRRRGKKRNL